MTRVLSELLGRPDAGFFLGLMQVERSAGRPSADIRLTVELQQGMRAKLKQLGLDPDDTTGEELYAVLGTKLKADENRFSSAIMKGSGTSAEDPMAYVGRSLLSQLGNRTCFALKTTAAKKLLKSNLPKKTMKLLGYRSADSMLKHETAGSLTAAAFLVEPEAWSKKQLASYCKLKASDFEIREVSIEHPSSKRWQTLSDAVVSQTRHNIAVLKEFGTVVLLPLSDERPGLAFLTATVLAVHAINDIHAASSYLKLHQVQSHFGQAVKQTVLGDTELTASLLDQPVSWNLVQQYFSRFRDSVNEQLFEPVLEAEDFAWHSVEQVLAIIEPDMDFWHGTSHLAHQHGNDIVSMNLTDLLLSHCNGLAYQSRIIQHFRTALSTELSLRYMMHDRLKQSIIGQVQNQLAFEPVEA